MKKKGIFSVILSVALIASMSLTVFAATGTGMGAANTTIDSETNSMTVHEGSRMDTNGASYSYTLKSANDYVLTDGTVIFAYKDIQELAKDVVDIRNYLTSYGIGGSGSVEGMITQYNPDHIYNAYDFVIQDGAIWRCKAGKTGVTGPFESALWDKVVDSADDTYDSNAGYVEGEFVIYNSILWYARQDIPAPAGEFDSSKWRKSAPIFDSTNYYLYVRNLQKYCDRLQAALDKLQSQTESTNAKPYDSTATYEPGDMITYEGKLYVCVARTSGDFDPSKWYEVDPQSGVAAETASNGAQIDSLNKDVKILADQLASTGIQVASVGSRESTGDTVINAVFDIDRSDLHSAGEYSVASTGTINNSMTAADITTLDSLISGAPAESDQQAMSDWFAQVKTWAEKQYAKYDTSSDRSLYNDIKTSAKNGLFFISDASYRSKYRTQTLSLLKALKAKYQ